RDFHVTGVQTCALPILPLPWPWVKTSLWPNPLQPHHYPPRRIPAMDTIMESTIMINRRDLLLGSAAGLLIGGLTHPRTVHAGDRSEERRVGKGGSALDA